MTPYRSSSFAHPGRRNGRVASHVHLFLALHKNRVRYGERGGPHARPRARPSKFVLRQEPSSRHSVFPSTPAGAPGWYLSLSLSSRLNSLAYVSASLSHRRNKLKFSALPRAPASVKFI